MARLTLRIPDSLHALLVERASREGVSMNQYVVFALSRITTADDIAEQKAAFDAMANRYPAQEAEAELQRMLDERE